ncbi:uncharacterized protein LOC106660814 isoform X2 [Cimex lectularius]|uniref:Angiomotin C-terminal domain-containing protein n=1 Tax=Cimex lectularius TaxID=79782 RepID=A0A8I6TAZ6_CIMLE|nr:uncharacterized protein LOC106660814 isoform X2 [Cimex lectularius]
MNPITKPTRYKTYSPSTSHMQVSTMRRGSGSETDISTSNENLSNEERYAIRHTSRQEPQGQENMAYNTLIIHEDSWPNRTHDGRPPPVYKPKIHNSNNMKDNGSYDLSVREITDIPDDYLRQSQVLKHLAKEVKVSSSAESSGESETVVKQSARSRLRSKLSKSQPDLSALSMADRENTLLRHTLGNTRKDQQRCAQMVDHLMQENNSLKSELESCYHRVAKAHKLEEEVGKVKRAHEELVATCERRERLEVARISRLQQEVRRLQETNQRLVTQHLLSPENSRVQLSKREALIARLASQNKELNATKERQEIELAAQRATLQEQRTHIDILDTALINAQANVVRLEEECRQKQVHVERVGQLQRALSSLQLASDRREQTERKLRLQLEQELQNERAKHNNTQETQGEGESPPELKRQLREKDEKIMWLEGEVAKWEQKYLEESQLRQAAIDAASIPKDAKIAALERTSQESEKLIAEARSDRIKQMDEVHAAQKKVTDLEAKVKELECKLAERDAMIRVLQKKHTLDKDVSSSYPSISLDTVPSLNTDLNGLANDNLGGVSTTSVFSTVSSALTSSTGFGSGASYTGSVDSYHHKYSTPTESFHHKSLDDQLKELDSQLMSKRGLCCFPGFAHPGASSRKGKIPQPLLAGVTGFESGGFLQGLVSVSSSGGSGGSGGDKGNNREEDMVLLEKQGLCSQQQRSAERCASLPPSSLPRPKRNKSGSKDRKLGEYGRLSDSEAPSGSNNANNSSTDTTETRQRESPVRIMPISRKLGEYGRLSDTESRNVSANSSSDNTERRESPSRLVLPLSRKSDYTRLSGDRTRKNSCSSNDGDYDNKRNNSEPSAAASSPGRLRKSTGFGNKQIAETEIRMSPINKFSRYSQFDDYKKVPHQSPTTSVTGEMRKTELPISFTKLPVPTRSFLPTPRKITDYGCFDQQKADPKLRLLPIVRRGSLHREPPNPVNKQTGVRSLPTPNKYRIQF